MKNQRTPHFICLACGIQLKQLDQLLNHLRNDENHLFNLKGALLQMKESQRFGDACKDDIKEMKTITVGSRKHPRVVELVGKCVS